MQRIRDPYRMMILVCVDEGEPGEEACGNRDSYALFRSLKRAVRERALDGEIYVARSRCLGQCEVGPNIAVYPDGAWYTGVREEDIPEILERHVRPG